MDSSYQALARRFRPKKFSDVRGQGPIVTTLLNGLRKNCLAHAYLFSGSRGTGKTTLARLLAKALNCTGRGQDPNPCNECSSCRDITSGSSLDVLEIDGASHRGIEDIRAISEGVGYAAAGGKFKIYIIDEVHMLTKEAFNALLKTLEEPPANVKFFFATTEPQKVLPTVLSRCQHFQLLRLNDEEIISKLRLEAAELGVAVDEAALHLISRRAEGGMRDAESLLDQIISFHGEMITAEVVAEVLGLVPRDLFFRLDEAAQNDQIEVAFEIAADIFSQGKDLSYFVDSLTEHYRTHLLCQLGTPLPSLPDDDRAQYQTYSKVFSRDQLLDLLDFLLTSREQLKTTLSKRFAVEMILTRVIRTRHRIPLEQVVKRLAALETVESSPPRPKPAPKPKAAPAPVAQQKAEPPKPAPEPKVMAPPSEEKPAPAAKPKALPGKDQSRYDTILRFAAVELEGTVNG